jgi:hypothetical protein
MAAARADWLASLQAEAVTAALLARSAPRHRTLPARPLSCRIMHGIDNEYAHRGLPAAAAVGICQIRTRRSKGRGSIVCALKREDGACQNGTPTFQALTAAMNIPAS